MSVVLTESLAEKLRYSIPRMKLLLVHESIPNHRRVIIDKPADAAKLLIPLKHSPDEQFVSIHLNAKNEVLGLHEVSHGTVSSSLVHPREVFKAAILANSYAILVCHNHPSGSQIVPSKEDIETTQQLVRSGKLLGVNVVDHLIVGPRSRPDFYSIRECHPELWND
ncbi:MAG TPA: JAB domain-containing protein [Planktothrix sp.]